MLIGLRFRVIKFDFNTFSAKKIDDKNGKNQETRESLLTQSLFFLTKQKYYLSLNQNLNLSNLIVLV